MDINTDVVIVGTGVAGLFSALNLPGGKKIVMNYKIRCREQLTLSCTGGNLCTAR